MKKKELNGHIEKIKENIDVVSKKSKESIRGIIDSSSKQFGEALDSNKKFMDSLEKSIFTNDLVNTSTVSDVKKTFGNSVELSEEAIDAIIDIQTKQLQLAIDLNLKLVERIQNFDFSNNEDMEELLQVIDKNFDESSAQLIKNSTKMTDIYNKHINLAVNFNERFSTNITSQLQLLNKFESRDMFNEWPTHWWKSSSKESATV